MTIGKCDICKYGQTDFCTSPNRASNHCCETYSGTTEIEKRIRADERTEMLMPYDAESIDELIENVRAKVLDELDNKIEEILKEPQYQHDGEDWRMGLIIAQGVLNELKGRK